MALNRQPGPMNENALQMLRDKELKKGADVMTSDGEFLGKALRLHHRPDEIDPELKLYASYLETSNLFMGSPFFIPVDFIADYDPPNTLVTLTVDVTLQNYFSLTIAIFYFVFLREYWDPLIFSLFAIVLVLISTFSYNGSSFSLDVEELKQLPLWLPMAWGTTAVALRKFFILVNKRIN